MHKLNLKQTHKPVKEYYEALAQFKSLRVSHAEIHINLVAQDIAVSFETQRIVKNLPEIGVEADTQATRA